MLTRLLLIGLSLGLFLASCQNSKEKDFDKEKYRAEMSGYAKDYMMGLKAVLVENMQRGGPLEAVNVCSDTAADLTKTFSEEMKVDIKRVSFKNRNVNNIPDRSEVKALKEFERLISEGKLNSDTDIIEIENISGNEVIKYFKPIIVNAPCLNCHGSEAEISRVVAEVINKRYPDDEATGYKIGDLRGAISVSKAL